MRKKRDPELQEAIDWLIKQYDEAKNVNCYRPGLIKNPVVYALYHTWRQMDDRRRTKDENRG